MSSPPSDRLAPWLTGLLIVAVAGLHLAYLAGGHALDLAPDEAHYWDWSRHLDWSYYSKGPLVAWLIRASCEAFGPLSVALTGHLTLAIRIPAVVCGGLLLASLYRLCVEVLGQPKLGLGLVAAAVTMPVLAAGSSLMTIDAPYTCCWGWALVFAHRAVTGRSRWAWEITGLLVGVGVLAKYTMVLFPASLALFLLFSPAHRRQLVSPGFARMVAVALACCLPIVIWNAQNGWVTFWHVFRLAGLSAAGEPSLRAGGGIKWLGPLAYVGTQAGLLLIYWFAVWLLAMILCNPLRQRDDGSRYLWWLSAPGFLVFFAFSVKTGGGEPNWPVTAYLSGSVLAAAWLARQLASPVGWLRVGSRVAVGMTMLLGMGVTAAMHHSSVLHPLLELVAGAPTNLHPYPVRRFDPTCRLRGWRYLAAQVDVVREELRARGIDPVLAGVSWSMPGELGVYCAGHPQAYSLGRIQGDRRSQYDLWPNPLADRQEFVGRTFVIVGPLAPEVVAGFECVEPPIWVTYSEAGRPLAGWPIHVCHGYRGFAAVPHAAH